MSIVLNIAITIPLSYLLPSVFRFTKLRYCLTIFTVLVLSVGTEIVQVVVGLGLTEINDLTNNVTEAGLGMVYLEIGLRKTIMERHIHDEKTVENRQEEIRMDS